MIRMILESGVRMSLSNFTLKGEESDVPRRLLLVFYSKVSRMRKYYQLTLGLEPFINTLLE